MLDRLVLVLVLGTLRFAQPTAWHLKYTPEIYLWWSNSIEEKEEYPDRWKKETLTMKNKSPGIALLLAMLFPGGGHYYCGRIASGIWYSCVFVLIMPFIFGLTSYTKITAFQSDPLHNPFPIMHPLQAVVMLIIWLFSLYSAYVDAQQFNSAEVANYKQCSKCAEMVKKEATVCRFCGNELQVTANEGSALGAPVKTGEK